MTLSRTEGGHVRMSEADPGSWSGADAGSLSGGSLSGADAGSLSGAGFEAMLARAAEQGARRALADVGLDGPEAALDIRDLRALLDSLRFVRRTAVQTAVRLVTTAVMLALLTGIAVKLKIFGGSP